jgi:thiosulfate dehydrogenase [quinone] large subunit
MLPVRLVASWLFLSAVWRRFVLAPGKHDFQSEAWLGHKINDFLPHANAGFYQALEYMMRNPEWLNAFTYLFTFTELVLGILLLLGLFSRATGLLLVSLSIGLMHTAGWLGPTCLDEWQIASLLVTFGAVMTLYGSGSFSADNWLMKQYSSLRSKIWWQWLSYPTFDTGSRYFRHLVIGSSLVLTVYVMAMNQVHHGGVWGDLHNYSKKPDIQLSELEIDSNGEFEFQAYRDKGPEAYGTFIIGVTLTDASGDTVYKVDRQALQSMSHTAIDNQYVNKIETDEHSLQIPLGAKGTLNFELPGQQRLDPSKTYRVKMTEIGGRTYSTTYQPER